MSRRAQLEAAVAVLEAELAALPLEPPTPPAATAAYMTLAEYAKHLRVSPRTLRRLIGEGLPVVRPRPRLVRIQVAAASEWMASRSRSATVAARQGSIQ
jgi:excisionase family DNA binding protein